MKKTLTALAVAASAMASGAAMAGWVPNGLGGELKLSGELTPADHVTPWEVMVGDAVTGLDAPVKKGQKIAVIGVKKSIPVLGIRTQSKEPFKGTSGISPQIDFKGAVSKLDNLADAEDAVLTLDVTDGANKIGKMVAPFIAAAQYSVAGPSANSVYKNMYAASSGEAFLGGLATVKGSIQEAFSDRVAALDSKFKAHFNEQDVSQNDVSGSNLFTNTEHTYSAWYGSGIESGKSIKITLDNPVSGNDKIQWHASLPVVVSYM